MWSLILTEKIMWVVEPGFFGKLIDAVISHGDKISFKNKNFFLAPLLIWSGIFLGNTILGFIRRMYSQKLHLEILTVVTEENYKKAIEKDVDNSILFSQTQNSRDYVAFLQNKIPEVLEILISVVGSVIALMSYDVRIGFTCLVLVFPLILMERISAPKLLLSQKEFHDRNQHLFEIVSSRDPKKVRRHMMDLVSPQLLSNRWSAFNFLLLRTALLLIFLAVLVISFDVDHFTTGAIYSIVSYLWTFISGIELLPELRETVSSIQDIDKRLIR